MAWVYVRNREQMSVRKDEETSNTGERVIYTLSPFYKIIK